MKKNSSVIHDSNVIDQCKKATVSNRVLKSSEAKTHAFDCNIQQIKCKEFDVLYYGLFFDDSIEIFCMRSSEVLKHPGYSNKQHRGNTGEGQFHIKRDNIDYHRKNHLIKTLSYDELYNLLSN